MPNNAASLVKIQRELVNANERVKQLELSRKADNRPYARMLINTTLNLMVLTGNNLQVTGKMMDWLMDNAETRGVSGGSADLLENLDSYILELLPTPAVAFRNIHNPDDQYVFRLHDDFWIEVTQTGVTNQ